MKNMNKKYIVFIIILALFGLDLMVIRNRFEKLVNYLGIRWIIDE